jgi:hypothetical protein
MDKEFAASKLRSLPFLVIEIDSGVILKRGTTELLIQGESALETVLLLLASTTDPGLTSDEICQQFPLQSRSEVAQLIQEMLVKRLLVTSESDSRVKGEPESNEDVFYWTAGTTRRNVVQAFATLNPVVIGVNRISQRMYQSLLEAGAQDIPLIDDPALRNTVFFNAQGRFSAKSFGAQRCMTPREFMDREWTAGCIIAASEFGSPSFLLPWNELCCKNKTHFMPVYLKDMIGYAGPLVIPGETPCLHCVRMRFNAHLSHPVMHTKIESEMRRGYPVAAIHP